MNQPRTTTGLAVLSAIVIGVVNLASMGAVYAVFNSAHKAPESNFATTEQEQTITSDSQWNTSQESTVGEDEVDSESGSTTNVADDQDGEANAAGNESDQATTDGSSSEQADNSSSGASGSNAGTSSTTGSTSSTPSSGSRSSTPTPAPSPAPTPTPSAPPPSPPPVPASLKKGSPCQTQTPPAGVCSAVLSFNGQKIGNSNWDATTMAAIKQGVADNDFVKLFRLNATEIFNSMQISLTENTWNGNAAHGTIDGKMGASGQSEDTKFTVDWNGSKWIVKGVAKK